MDASALALLVAVILACVASIQPSAGPFHLGWLAVAAVGLSMLI